LLEVGFAFEHLGRLDEGRVELKREVAGVFDVVQGAQDVGQIELTGASRCR